MIILSTKYENGNLKSGKEATRIRCPSHTHTQGSIVSFLFVQYWTLTKPPHSSSHLNHLP